MPGHYQVGKVYRRGEDLIYITRKKEPGSLGVSNFWHWRVVKKNGKLGEEEWGYGEFPVEPIKCEIKIKIIEEGISLG